MRKCWAKCSKCGKELTHEEWMKESIVIPTEDGWDWTTVHKKEFCKKKSERDK